MSLKSFSMIAVLMIMGFLLTSLGSGCASKQVKPVAGTPSLGAQLDRLFLADIHAWVEMMNSLISSDTKNIPARHLIRAIQEWNDISTEKVCRDAAFLYLRVIANADGRFTGDDEIFFRQYTDVVLKSDDSNAVAKVNNLCRMTNLVNCNLSLHN